MAKLYPPVIEGTIPAFYGTTLVVPFSMNRAVSKADIKGFSLKIKTIQTNTFIANITSSSYDTTQAKFDISSAGLVPGQYYKIQLAYISNDEYSTVNYYSTVGVVKYYGETGPKIYINGLSNKKSNLFAGYYLGVFEHEDDPMEKIAQYRFVITYSSTGEIFYDTGWLLHNTINDVDSLSANDIFKYTDDLDDDTTYYIQYQVLTSNKMECSSPKYNIMQKNSIGTTINFEFIAETDYDDGFVRLNLKSLGSAGENATLTGAFEISRQNIKNPRHWEVIDLFILQNEVATKTFWRDFTVTHGETYRYAVRQFNEAGVYTDRVISNEVFVDFEDAFLFDGKRQLKIRYNPKVSSFKNDIPESKTDTIGSKYPFIFRNGHVNYKEFPISGLISYFSDEQELFLTNDDIGIVDITSWEREDTPTEVEIPLNAKTTNLTNYNIAAERRFKLEALEWLTNGKPKLFRSPAEGNYIVRLLNTSLTPTDSVGRMLHTFNSTAYEVAECSYENLVGFGFIDNGLSEEEKQRNYYRTIPLGYQTHENDIVKYDENYIPIVTGKNANYKADDYGYIELLVDPYGVNSLHAYSIYFDDMTSGDIIWINDRRVIIGNTGQYIIEKAENINSVKIRALPGYDEQGHYSREQAVIDKNTWAENAQTKYLEILNEEQEKINLKDWTEDYKEEYMENFRNKLNEEWNPIFTDIAYTRIYDTNLLLNDYTGLFTYKYTDIYANSFDLIVGQTLVDHPCRQFIGGNMEENILSKIINTRTELLDILQIQAELKQIEDIYTWKDAAAFKDLQLSYNEFNKWFSFDKTKMPGEDKGNSYGEITGEIFNPQKNSLYIYKIHPIFQHSTLSFDEIVPYGYKESLSPWELEELRGQVVEMLSRYGLTLAQVSEFIQYKNNNSVAEKIQRIKLVVADYLLLEKYYGKEEFHYGQQENGKDPEDWHPDILWVYENGYWIEKAVEYHKNEQYYVDANYYKVNQFTKTLDNYDLNSEYLNKNKFYYIKEEDGTYSIIEDIGVYLNNYKALNPDIQDEDITPYKLGLFEKTAYKNYDKYHTFEDDFYLIYDASEDIYRVVDGYSSRIYINTGVTSGVTAVKQDLYTRDGQILQPYIDLAETGSFKTTLIPEITDIYVGDGVILNLSYQTREIDYVVEETSSELNAKKIAWQNAIKDYTDLFYTKRNTAEELYDYNDDEWANNYDNILRFSKIKYNAIGALEKDYLECLDEKIERYKEDRGIE